jgi:cathepsin F
VCTYKTDVDEAVWPNPPASNPAGLFEEFAAAMGRIYESAEQRQHRFSVFVENLGNIAKMQVLDEGATYSHKTPFADWTVEEFQARNTLKPHLHDASMLVQDEVHNTSNLPAAVDWVAKGAVNEVKNQGSCGSCWAFSTVANIEGVNFVKTQKLVSLSEQELVDCDHTGPDGDQGCQGGLPSNAFKFLLAKGTGLEPESKYPYSGKDKQSCVAAKSDEIVFISSWKQIASDEDQMAAALVSYGPLSIGINAGPMQWYMGGIANPFAILCNPKSIDHGVAIVGYGSEPKNYWTIRNSWGPTWGEKGYYRIVRGVNKCGLTTMPTTAVIGGSTSVIV